jgi:hypothetical protein
MVWLGSLTPFISQNRVNSVSWVRLKYNYSVLLIIWGNGGGGACVGDKIEKNEMGGACSANGGAERCVQGFGGETGGKETIWETQA